MTRAEGGHRRLRVLVTAVAIEDGTIAQPKVGDIGVFPLRFIDPATGDGADPSVVTLRATAEPAGAPVWQCASAAVAPRWEWTVLLRGAGWTATWHTPRPVIGDVEVTGHLVGDLGYCTDGQVRGRIIGVRVVADRYRGRFGVPSSWEILPGGRTYRHVTEAPGGFGDELAAFDRTRTDIVEGHREIGVLVDVDLDDVPEPPVRPSLIPESVSAHGEDLWVGDTVLPLVVRLAADRTVTEYLLPGPVTTDPAPRARRRVRATPSGCWVFGRDGLYRCENTGAVERVGETSLSGGVVLGETFLGDATGGRDTSELVICRPQGRPLRITAPTAGLSRC
ncbi:hypothetical protein [Rhodococcus jostii]|uniref:hypothetical protein n=1 Tax=Rhodococcus jostii TaxID=132919 RepID=UPI00363E2CAE